MKTVIRYDSAELKAREDSDGFLHDSPVVARTGIMVYRNADGTVRRELRTREDASSPGFLESMVGKPIIVTHKLGMVNQHSAKGNVVGTMLSARHDGDKTRAQIVIHDGEAIKMARQNIARELSLGYRLELENRAGYYNADSDEISDVAKPGFEPFDVIQRSIRVNHLALVRRARAGEMARLNLDGDEITINEANLMKIKLPNGVEVEVTEEVGAAYNDQMTRLDGVSSELSTTKGTLIAVSAERDQLKVEVNGFEDKLKKSRMDAMDELKATDALIKSVAHKVTDTDGKSDVEIKSAFLKAVMPAINLDGMEDAAIDGAFAVALASHPATKDTNGQRKTATGQRGDAAEDENDGKTASQIAQEKHRARLFANNIAGK
ncbi:head maturation protease [Pantoea phage vB_PagM_LIET2]|uniref:Putative scaffolding protein n=1 Tax=Pantoea phage vB_PagM_LIET2 TaxID=2508071 RepID=A0A411AW08_9CAUD|nr:head maturation protease [Pantoea phage vB_PagM_LIET2]QAX92281.1 putative scaffolding protein [Pantoea phage vB_PagM_LIET2]